ncbi:MAG: LLM class flavin-dependent oxidoreductase [SAR202 cluster bacterium]|nr:LLM class flavin-dependent oxidoreductase [SAR202 cluster bacterium]HCP24277.1 LLM class flavin-dependent oxidoreductase [Dehalococcoidia bacterium]|tara:strand:- start:830 stop:1903 length:1074 start_codon:yes stop_codon:yes gene_type:complete
MHVGTSTFFQNPNQSKTDFEVYQNELRLADMVEPLGYESIWGVEHHFTDYTMCPDVLQFLSYMAGRTEKVLLGSMVVVLPWHDPMRVAEQFSVLDHLSGGRAVVGVGRGLARVEYDAFKLDMAESRTRFAEGSKLLVQALEEGVAEFDGELIKQPRADIRPKPYKSFKGRTYAAAVSPESSLALAELGLGMLIIPQKPWHDVEAELKAYRETFMEINGAPPPAPVVVGFTFCHEDEETAREMASRHIGNYWGSVMDHYEFKGAHLKTTRGYEYYGKFSEKIEELGDQAVKDFFVDLQVWGTPEQCYEKIMEIRGQTGHDSFLAAFSYGGLPYDEAEKSMKLFAKEVMPRLKEVPAAV